jgi:hypothetical protein
MRIRRDHASASPASASLLDELHDGVVVHEGSQDALELLVARPGIGHHWCGASAPVWRESAAG